MCWKYPHFRKHLVHTDGVVRALLFCTAQRRGHVTLTAELLMGLFVAYGYWIVFTAILLDNAGLPIPGELLLLAFGVVAKAGHLDPLFGLAVAATAALAGDSLGYWLGRVGGTRVLKRLGGAPRFTPGRLSVVFGRFVVGARVLLAPLAGLTRMPFRRFLMFDALGCLAWAGVFILIGYASNVTLESMQAGLRVVSVTAQVLIAAALTTWGISRLLTQRRARRVEAEA
jgi:membrane protein DedA with SNARE-associated domain